MRHLFLLTKYVYLVLATLFICTETKIAAQTKQDTPKQYNGLNLTLALPKDHFFRGEIIPATLTFTNRSNQTYRIWRQGYDYRSGRLSDTTFHATDGGGQPLPDPLDWFFRNDYLFHGPRGGIDNLKIKQITVPANQWLRFDHAGIYTLQVISAQVSLGTDSDNPGKPILLVSNTCKISIDPCTPELEAITLAAAKTQIAMGGSQAHEGVDRIRYLDTPSSRNELILLLEDHRPFVLQAKLGLAATSKPSDIAPLILEALREGRLQLSIEIIRFYARLKNDTSNGSIWSPNNKSTIFNTISAPDGQEEVIAAAKIGAKGNEAKLAHIAEVLSAHRDGFRGPSQMKQP